MSDRGILSSLRYLFADFIGEDDDTPPFLPEGLPPPVMAAASDAIHFLIDYQGTSYAELYVHRLRRFVGKQGVDEAMLAEIARLTAVRMAYEDPIRIAQLKLAELNRASGNPARPAVDIRKFTLEELIGVLPAVVSEYVLDALDWAGWSNKRVSIRFSAASRFGIRRLKIEAGLRRWRLFSVRYAKERVWVERWLHMIDRSLTKQPQAAPAIVQTATMIEGYGDVYRQGLRTGMRSSTAWSSRPSTACWPCRISPVRWLRRAPPHCPTRGRRRSSARSPKSARGRRPARTRPDFMRSARSSRPPPCRPGTAGAA